MEDRAAASGFFFATAAATAAALAHALAPEAGILNMDSGNDKKRPRPPADNDGPEINGRRIATSSSSLARTPRPPTTNPSSATTAASLLCPRLLKEPASARALRDYEAEPNRQQDDCHKHKRQGNDGGTRARLPRSGERGGARRAESGEPAERGPELDSDTDSRPDCERNTDDRPAPPGDKRRTTVAKANREFCRAAFVRDGDGDGEDGSRPWTCTICRKPVPPRSPSNLVHHSLNHSCLAARAGLNLDFAAPAPVAGGGGSGSGSGRGPLPYGFVPDTLKAYCDEHFLVPTQGADPRVRVCRHCRGSVKGQDHKVYLVHVASCVGVATVVRELELALRTAADKCRSGDHRTGPLVSEGADGSRRSPPADSPRVRVRRANREFCRSSFVPDHTSSSSSDGSRPWTCTICHQLVRLQEPSHLVAHSLSQSCLAARIGRGLTAETVRDGAVPLPSGLVRRTLTAYCNEHFIGPTEGGDSPRVRVCRHCHGNVKGQDNRYYLAHLASCVGIATVIRDLEGALRTAADSDEAGCGRVPIADGRKANVRNANQEFCRSTFVLEDVGSSWSRQLSCIICCQPVPPRAPSELVKHSLSRSCLAARVKRLLQEMAGGTSSLSALASATFNDGDVLVPTGLFPDTLKRYCGEHFLVPTDGGDPSVRACRHCQRNFKEGNTQDGLLHLGRCVGVATVVRDLEGALRTAAITSPSGDGAGCPVGAGDGRRAARRTMRPSTPRRAYKIRLPYR